MEPQEVTFPEPKEPSLLSNTCELPLVTAKLRKQAQGSRRGKLSTNIPGPNVLNPTDLARAPESLLFPQQRNQLRRTSHHDAMQNKRGDVTAGSISKDTLWGTGCPDPSRIKGYQISNRVQACFVPSLSYPNPETLRKALLSKDSSLSPWVPGVRSQGRVG